MTSEEMAAIHAPVLIMQVSTYQYIMLYDSNEMKAERSQTHPMEYAERLVEGLVNVPSGATLFPVKGVYLSPSIS